MAKFTCTNDRSSYNQQEEQWPQTKNKEECEKDKRASFRKISGADKGSGS